MLARDRQLADISAQWAQLRPDHPLQREVAVGHESYKPGYGTESQTWAGLRGWGHGTGFVIRGRSGRSANVSSLTAVTQPVDAVAARAVITVGVSMSLGLESTISHSTTRTFIDILSDLSVTTR